MRYTQTANASTPAIAATLKPVITPPVNPAYEHKYELEITTAITILLKPKYQINLWREQTTWAAKRQEVLKHVNASNSEDSQLKKYAEVLKEMKMSSRRLKVTLTLKADRYHLDLQITNI